jgi:hypothetical protein
VLIPDPAKNGLVTSLGYVWDPVLLDYVVATQSSGGGGGAATIANGADVAEGATTDAEAAAGNGSVVAILKRLRTLLSNPLAVTGAFFQATQPVSLAAAVDVSDRAARALGVIASITAAVDVSDRAARALGVIASITAAVDVSDRSARALGKVSQQEREAGYANVALYAEAVAGIIAETAISINKSVAYAAAAAATSNGASAAKELVIIGMIISWVSTSTTANTARVRIRVNPAGAAIITSPIALTFRISWESATFIANEGEFQPIYFDKAIVIPNPGQFMATIACVAANGTLDIQLLAYERAP